MKTSKLLKSSECFLRKNNVRTYKLDSEIILENVLDKRREELFFDKKIEITKDQFNKIRDLLGERANKKPIAHIFKNKDFWRHSFFVNKDALIPRPETELLVESLVNLLKKRKGRILDLGSGTGCIVLSILFENKNFSGIGIDKSVKAINIARKNSLKLNLNHKVKFIRNSIEELNFSDKFDVIVSNPPYLKHSELVSLMEDVKRFEPRLALNGGKDGLDVIKKVIYKSDRLLKVNGLLALEIGLGQYKKVSQILKKNNFIEKKIIIDNGSNIRGIISLKIL